MTNVLIHRFHGFARIKKDVGLEAICGNLRNFWMIFLVVTVE